MRMHLLQQSGKEKNTLLITDFTKTKSKTKPKIITTKTNVETNTATMPLDKMHHNDSTNRRHRISICATSKMLVRSMEPLRTLGRNVLRKAFSDKYLLATNMTIALTLCTLADVIEQNIEYYMERGSAADGNVAAAAAAVATVPGDGKWDYIRTRNMGLAGCLVECICHFWYQYLDRRLPDNSLGVVFKKIALDQLVCAPVYIVAFFVLIGILENESPHEIWKDVKTKAVRYYIAEWIVWPPAQFINFYWLPTRYRVVYDSLISLGYDVYASRINYYEYSAAEDPQKSTGLLNKIQRSVFSTQEIA